MSDWTTDPAEIPPSGERQDMTLSKMGFARNHSPDDDNPTKLVLQCVIDNGEYEGFRLSNAFLLDNPQGEGTLKAFVKRTGLHQKIPKNIERALYDGTKVAVGGVKKETEKEFRFSALVNVKEVEKESERLATYNLTGFDTAREEANLTLQTEPRQFYRD
jgi:hypothetical protein